MVWRHGTRSQVASHQSHGSSSHHDGSSGGELHALHEIIFQSCCVPPYNCCHLDVSMDASTSRVHDIELSCFADVCDLQKLTLGSERESDDAWNVVVVLLLYASWNQSKLSSILKDRSILNRLAASLTEGLERCEVFVTSLQIDACDESISLC